jgi:hypothetical protein
VCAILLALFDVPLHFWRPQPARLPENFSPAYLERICEDLSRGPKAIIVLGDSVVWGYKLPASDAPIAILARMLPAERIVNLSYEGGSIVNDDVLLRYLLAHGVRPKAVITNINSKEFNILDSAYNTLHPSLEYAAQGVLTTNDALMLQRHFDDSLNGRLSRAVASVWMLYGFRADIKQMLFSDADAASAADAWFEHLSGAERRRAAEHRVTPDNFLGVYDLSPIARSTNVEYKYLIDFRNELIRQHIPALAFLTPTNHQLLGEYIDNDAYLSNLRLIRDAFSGPGIRTVDFDRAIPYGEFIDNDHMSEPGSKRLAFLLSAALQKSRL